MQHTQHRFAAFALATLITLVMAAGMDHLATSQPPAGLLAQISQTAHAGAQT